MNNDVRAIYLHLAPKHEQLQDVIDFWCEFKFQTYSATKGRASPKMPKWMGMLTEYRK